VKAMGMSARVGASRRLRLGALLVPCLAPLVVGACEAEPIVKEAGQEQTDTAAEMGVLRLPLVTPETGRFRLRNASFQISRGAVPVVTLDSEVDPDAEALTADLSPGQYQIDLADGWALEELAADGTSTPVRAALVSQNPASFSVRNERTTVVAYTFTTASGQVTFGEGAVSVRLGVADPASLSSCDVANQSGCPAGQHCILGSGEGDTFCATPGDLPVGAPCSSEQCVFGSQCLALDGAESTCTELCNPEFPVFGCDCRGLSVSDDVGVCGPPPAGSCDLLDSSVCGEGLTCQFQGGSFGVCGAPGPLSQGASCFGEECQAGMECFGDDPVVGFTGTCLFFCDLSAPQCEFCFDVGTGNVGRCFF
jgi:hypothetical protein